MGGRGGGSKSKRGGGGGSSASSPYDALYPKSMSDEQLMEAYEDMMNFYHYALQKSKRGAEKAKWARQAEQAKKEIDYLEGRLN